MTQDERLEEALARLAAAVASLEAVSRRIPPAEPPDGTLAPDPAGELERAVAKVERLEAANEEVSRVLHVAIEALAAILSSQGEVPED